MTFDEGTVAVVLDHMNDEHPRDVLTIVRGHGSSRAIRTSMTGFDALVARFEVLDDDGLHYEIEVPWPHAPLVDRTEINHQIMLLFATARQSR